MEEYFDIYDEIIDAVEQQDITKGCNIFMEKIAPHLERKEKPDGSFAIESKMRSIMLDIMLSGTFRGADDVYMQACLIKITRTICNVPVISDEQLIADAKENVSKAKASMS